MESVKIKASGYESECLQTWDHKGLTQIVQIIVSYDEAALRSLQFQYLEDGHLRDSEVLGCSNFTGPMFHAITFQGSHEYITKVEGITNNGGIQKLSIHTNFKMYEIFEAKTVYSTFESIPFSFNFGGLNQFGGFHGSYDSESFGGGGVQSIGVYFKRLTTPPPGYLQDQPLALQRHEDEDHVDLNIC